MLEFDLRPLAVKAKVEKSIDKLEVEHPVPSGEIVKGSVVASSKVSPAIGIVKVNES